MERAWGMIDTMRLFAVTLDCPDPLALARFYRSLLGGSIDATNDTFAALTLDEGPRLDFQRVVQYRQPTWPDPDTPTQMHLDLVVDDLDRAERLTISLGGEKAAHQPGGDRFRVFIDPDGHPFCLVTPEASTVR